jgi:hypothetical protein
MKLNTLKLKMIMLVCLGFTMNVMADGWESGPCAEDVKKLCANVEKGEGRIIRCLKEHEAELSPACKEKREEKKAKSKEMRTEMRKARLEARKAKIDNKIKAMEAEKVPPPAPGAAPAAH